MALTPEQIANLLFKKEQGKGSTNNAREFFEEPRDGSRRVLPSQVWQQAEDIPATAPSLAHEGEDGVVKYFEDLSLTPVPGVPNSFSSDDLIDAIPFNFGDGSYNYVLKDDNDNAIPFGQGDWIVDGDAGVLTFYGAVPANMPPKISFYKYIGDKGVGDPGGGGSGTGKINFLANGNFELGDIDHWEAQRWIQADATETQIDEADDTVFFNGHGFKTGQRVLYTQLSFDGITNLTSDTSYFVIRNDSSTFKLATTRANAIAGTEIDLVLEGATFSGNFRQNEYYVHLDSFTSSPPASTLLTVTRNETTPLNGDADLSITKSDSDASFHSVRALCSIPRGYRGGKIFLTKLYDFAHANFDGDWRIGAWDITNDKEISIQNLAGLNDDNEFFGVRGSSQSFLVPDSDCEEFYFSIFINEDQSPSDALSVFLDDLIVTPEASVPGVITREVELSGASNQFTGGTVRVVQVGNIINITSDGLTHASASDRETASGFLPEWARPSVTQSNAYFGTSINKHIEVESGGTIRIRYRLTSAGTASNQTTSGALNISYSIDSLASAAIGANEVAIMTPKFYGQGNAGEAITANVTDIPFISVSDPQNLWDGDKTKPLPRSGRLNFSGAIGYTGAAARAARIYVNGTGFHIIARNPSDTNACPFSGQIDVKAGDVVSIRSINAGTLDNTFVHALLLSYEPDLTLFASLATQQQVAYLKDVKAQNTDGDSIGTSYADITLNTVEGDTSIVSLNSNKFTLGPGDYLIDAPISFNYSTQNNPVFRAKLVGITPNILGLNGRVNAAATGAGGTGISHVEGKFRLTQETELSIQAASSVATTAGSALNRSGESEVYHAVKITKLL